MPSYADRNRSLLYALSDFWTQIFADTDTIESMYRGAEILVGQIYLDLLGDVLNMSVRDTALFRQELFRLIRLREDTVLRAPDGRYRVPLGADIVDLKVLNNKVFAVTAALEQGVDFDLTEARGVALFNYDPTAAHPVLEWGNGRNLLRFTGVLPGAPCSVSLVDDGSSPPVCELAVVGEGSEILVRYDGPANGNTTSAVVVADAITAHPAVGQRLRAECLVTQGPVFPPTATSGYEELSFARALPAEGFGARYFPATFHTQLVAPGTPAFGAELGIEKGDILRLAPSARTGSSVEVPIALVRDDALYSHLSAAPADTEDYLLRRRDYSILRTPRDYKVEREAWLPFTHVEVYGDIDRETGTIHVPGLSATTAWALLTDTVFLSGSLNAGPVVLTAWNPATERFSFVGTETRDETSVPIIRTISFLSGVSVGGTYTMVPVAGMPGYFDLTGVAGYDGCVGGVLYLTDDLTIAGMKARVVANNGGVLRFTDAQFEIYTPTGPLLGVSIFTPVSATPERATRLRLDKPVRTGDAPELRTQLLEGSLVVRGRRLLDGEALVEGVDWTYTSWASGIRWHNVPDERAGITFDYEYRQVLFDSSDLATTLSFPAAIGTVSPTDGRIMLYDNTLAPITHAWAVGDRIELDAGPGAVNTGTYYVAAILPDGYVVLDGGHVPVLPEPANGTLGVRTWPTGTLDVTGVTERIAEVAMWAPDIRVDRMSLATTYGYLLDRIEPSSESYRSTLRGLMQLYMLGPTIARLEAAVHVLAGLPVVRDDNELVLRYERGVTQSGTGLVLDGPALSARLLTGSFAAGPFEGYLVVTSGFNAGRVFRVETKASTTELALLDEPYTDTGGGLGVSWEIVRDSTHAIVTDRNRYVLPLHIPFKAALTDPASAGTLRLRAFSTFSDAVVVKDEVSHPGWWQSARIPAPLWPGEPLQRLQSSPAYVEHVIDAADDARIGDPGYYIGTDDSGAVFDRPVITDQSPDMSAVLTMDPYAPFSYENATFYTTAYSTSTSHVGYVIETTMPDGSPLEMQILGVVDSNTWRVGLPMVIPGGAFPCPIWRLVIDPAILRHTTAFIIYDRYLKRHVFSVEINASLLGEIDTTLLRELQERLREVRPAHTYMTLSPSSTFVDVLSLTEDMLKERAISPGGSSGEAIVASENILRIDGTWRIGDYFRYSDWTRTDAIGGALPIAASPVGYFTDVHAIEWVSGVTLGGDPAKLATDMSDPASLGSWVTSTDAVLGAADASGGAWVTFPTALPPEVLQGNSVLSTVTLSANTQPGTYRIGRIDAENNRVRIYIPGGVAEPIVTASIERGVAFAARVERQSDGSVHLLVHNFSVSAAWMQPTGQMITAEPFVDVVYDGDAIASGLVDPAAPWQVGDLLAPGVYSLGFAVDSLGTMVALDAQVTFDGTDYLLELDPATPVGDLFTPELGAVNRASLDPATAGVVQAGVFFEANENASVHANIVEVRSPYVAVLGARDAPLLVSADAPFRYWRFHAATVPAAPFSVPVRFVTDPQRRLLRVPAQDSGGTLVWGDVPVSVDDLLLGYIDTASVTFNASGRQSPVDIALTPADPALGDTPYAIGGLSPSVRGLRRRGQRDFDLIELPLEITRTPYP